MIVYNFLQKCGVLRNNAKLGSWNTVACFKHLRGKSSFVIKCNLFNFKKSEEVPCISPAKRAKKKQNVHITLTNINVEKRKETICYTPTLFPRDGPLCNPMHNYFKRSF